MAVDKSLLDAITGGYKFYLDDMKSKNITGQYYDEVERLFKRIEELGEECSDMNEPRGFDWNTSFPCPRVLTVR